jgi:hypothetical protein
MKCTFHKKNARCDGRLQANKDDSARIMANNHDKRRITTNKDDSRPGYASVVNNRACSSLIVLLFAVADCAFWRSKTGGRWAVR